MNMARPRAFDKDNALEEILLLIWAHGSSGLSLDDIGKKLKLSKTSLYSAFGNKSALLRQCFELYEEQYEQPMLASFQGETLQDSLCNFLKFSSHRFDSLDSPPGCFMFNCSVERASLPEDFRLKVEQGNLDFKQALRDKVVAHKYDTETADIDKWVDMLLVNLFGLASASRMNFPLNTNYLSLLKLL